MAALANHVHAADASGTVRKVDGLEGAQVPVLGGCKTPFALAVLFREDEVHYTYTGKAPQNLKCMQEPSGYMYCRKKFLCLGIFRVHARDTGK